MQVNRANSADIAHRLNNKKFNVRTNMKKLIPIALSAFSALVLTACGGGSSSTVSQTPTGFSVEGGIAQKGPLLKGSRITVAELNPLNYMPSGVSYDLLTTDNMGGFSSSGINFTRQHIQTFAQGYYLNEITGEQASDSVLLQAQGDLTTDRLVNVNLLTTLAGPRTVALVTDSTNAYKLSTYRNFAKSRTQAQKEVLAAFRIYNGADMMSGDTSTTTVTIPNNFSELDIAKDATPNKVLIALSAVVMNIGVNGVGVSQFIANFQLDLKDDGLINGTAGSSALQSQINTASKAVNMSTVAANLTSFYASSINLNALLSTSTFTAAQLTPWVDSSGGTDLVVDGFKAASTTATANVVSKSSKAYVAGSDDDGQCFSVGTLTNVVTNATGATSGVTGALYVGDTAATATLATTPVLVAKGRSVVLGLTAGAAGTYSGYIQRTPAASGACNATSTGTVTRVFKYTITTSGSTAPTVSGVPTGVAAAAGSGQATVTFTAPISTGGSAIQSYTAACQIGTNSATNVTATGTTTSIVVSGLTNGSAYSCSVKATNGIGDSAFSSGVTVTPAAAVTVTVPGAPSIGTAVAGAAQAAVAFTAPASNGGATISSYTASCVTGNSAAVTANGPSSPITVTSLTNGSEYSCSVTATNSAGTGTASAAVKVIPVASTSGKPSAPTISSIVPGSSGLIINFAAASSGTAATSYYATCTPTGGTAVKSASFAASPIVIGTLTNSLAYSCTVTATNSAGDGTASTPTPGTPAASTVTMVAPAIKGILPGDSRISVQFNFIGGKVTELTSATDTPAAWYNALCTSSDGGVSNTSWGSAEYSSGASSKPMANVTNPLVVSGLTNGKTYSCVVMSGVYANSVATLQATSSASATAMPNAGPSNAAGVLSATANTTHITTYPTYASYCDYTNQIAIDTGAVPTITYSTSDTSTTTGTSQAAFTCTGTTTRTLTGNALPDHRSSEFFTNGLSGYTGSPYFSGNPNKIGTKVVSKAMPYSGTISAAYTMGSNGYDTAGCYAYTSALSPSQNANNTFTNTAGIYRCKFVSYNYANNSVLLEPGTAETYTGTTNTYKVAGKNLYQDVGLDPSNAHNQPTISGSTTSMYGNYHYHGIPEGHVARIGKGNSTMTLVAFAADGFPIYARYGYSTRTSATGGVKVMKSNYRLRTTAELTAAGYNDRPSTAIAPLGTFEQDWTFDATAGGDLDACNGRYGVTPESPTTPVYHYFLTDSYPFVQRCVFGQSPASWANGN